MTEKQSLRPHPAKSAAIPKILAIIPVRSGSKGIINKNVRNFAGKPLLYYPISIAKKSGIFDRIIIDTDSESIAGLAKELDAEVPYLRPKHLATDSSVITDAILLLLKRLKRDQYEPDVICLLQTTSPLREIEDVLDCYKMLKKPGIDSVVTVCESHPRLYHLRKDRKLTLVNKETENIINRQQVPAGYMLNGCIVYMIKTNTFLKKKKFIYDGTYAVVSPKWRSVDLDEIEDWVHTELLYKNKEEIKKKIQSFK